jgi:septal ring factor EnvC (AmiA/AmiB activator)
MEHIDLIATVVTVLVAVVGLGFYLRSDMRANQAVLAELFRTEIGRLDQKIDSVEERLNQRVDGLAELFRSEIGRLDQKIDSVEERLNQRVDGLAELFRSEIGRLDQKIDSVEERLNQRIDGVETRLTNQMQANHRELLLRLAFHHHGDGRYPIVPSSDPEPVDPTGSN